MIRYIPVKLLDTHSDNPLTSMKASVSPSGMCGGYALPLLMDFSIYGLMLSVVFMLVNLIYNFLSYVDFCSCKRKDSSS